MNGIVALDSSLNYRQPHGLLVRSAGFGRLEHRLAQKAPGIALNQQNLVASPRPSHIIDSRQAVCGVILDDENDDRADCKLRSTKTQR